MAQTPSRAPGEPRSQDELRAQAKDFIEQYYTSIKRWVVLVCFTVVGFIEMYLGDSQSGEWLNAAIVKGLQLG